MNVSWVTGRKKALARAMALQWVQRDGRRWADLPERTKRDYVNQALGVINQWIATDVLAQFSHEYREKTGE